MMLSTQSTNKLYDTLTHVNDYFDT